SIRAPRRRRLPHGRRNMLNASRLSRPTASRGARALTATTLEVAASDPRNGLPDPPVDPDPGHAGGRTVRLSDRPGAGARLGGGDGLVAPAVQPAAAAVPHPRAPAQRTLTRSALGAKLRSRSRAAPGPSAPPRRTYCPRAA